MKSSSKKEQPFRQIKGSGLELLFGDSDTQVTPNTVAISSIQLPSQQPRRYFDPNKMEQLIQSVKEHGILEPLLVRPLTEDTYELVAGERRYRAAMAVELEQVPVVIRYLSDDEALQMALIENLHREDLNPVEETEGILELIGLRLEKTVPATIKILQKMQNQAEGKVTHNVMRNDEPQIVESIFNGLGLMTWESFVKNRLPLLNLPKDVMERLREGKIAYTKAKVIARIEDKKQREELLEEAITEELSLSQIRAKVKILLNKEDPKVITLETKFDQTYRRLKKAKVWSDPEKKERLESLIQEIESILGE
jgi:ParB family transcriptional regulator, chromosome partitioning protein